MAAFYYDITTPTPSFSWALSSGTLTVSAEGTAKITMEKQGSPGEKIELDISGMSWTIDDDNGSDEFVGSHGIDNDVAWGSAMPWFPYLVNKDNTPGSVVLGLSRDPTARVTPASTDNIGCKGTGAAATSAQGNFFLTSAVVTAYNSLPCQLIDVGLSAIASDGGTVEADVKWTFTAPAAGDCLESLFADTYTMPVGQNGAEAGNYFTNSAPNFTGASYTYTLSGDGVVALYFASTARTSVGGDASATRMVYPLTSVSLVGLNGTGYAYYTAKGNTIFPYQYNTASTAFVGWSYASPPVVVSPVNNGWGAADFIVFQLTFKAF